MVDLQQHLDIAHRAFFVQKCTKKLLSSVSSNATEFFDMSYGWYRNFGNLLEAERLEEITKAELYITISTTAALEMRGCV